MASGFGVRVLVVGESHYGTKGQGTDRDFTHSLVSGIVDGAKPPVFFTKASKVLTLDDVGSAQVWRDVAFCNYLQVFKEANPRGTAPQEAWAASRSALDWTVAQLDPQVILVLSNRVGHYLGFKPLRGQPTAFCHHPSSSGQTRAARQEEFRVALGDAGGAPWSRP